MFRSFRDYVEAFEAGHVDFTSNRGNQNDIEENETGDGSEVETQSSTEPSDDVDNRILKLQEFVSATELDEEDEEEFEEEFEEEDEEDAEVLSDAEEEGAEIAVSEADEEADIAEFTASRLGDEDLDAIWNQIISDILNESPAEVVSEKPGKKSSKVRSEADVEQSGSSGSSNDELESLKQVVSSLAEWQQAVQQYLAMNTEAESIKEVLRVLASLGIILPDEVVKEVAELSQKLNVPPSVLLKSRAYDLLLSQSNPDEVPFQFMQKPRNQSVVNQNVLGSQHPFASMGNEPIRTGFTGLENFLNLLMQESE